MLPFYQFTTIDLGPVSLQVWGLFVALGLACSVWLGAKEAERRGLSKDDFYSLALWVIVAALVGSRLFYLTLYPSELSSFGQAIAIWNGGMVAYGGILFGIAAILIFAKTKKIASTMLLDTVAVTFGAGYALGRLGCHFIRDHMGSITTMPWGFEVAEGISRHDTALYSVLTGLIIFLLLWPQRAKITQIPGKATALVIFVYSTTRFFIDALRATDLTISDPRWLGLTISQFISLGAFVASSAFLIRLLQKRPKNA